MAPRQYLRSTKRNLKKLRSPSLFLAIDLLIVRLRARNSNREVEQRQLLLAPPGGGNIGDQALVEAFVENTEGPITVVMRAASDYSFSPPSDRVSKLVLPGLVYGGLFSHSRDMWRFAAELRRASQFSVVGADVMDGAYMPSASFTRANLATAAARVGVPTRVLGFSWNAAPTRAASKSLARAGNAGARILVRDPISYDRVRSIVETPVLSADLVFAVRSDEITPREVETEGLAGAGSVAIVNASGLVGPGALESYVAIVDYLRARFDRVVILPHVSRFPADDLPICRAIYRKFEGDGRVVLIDRLLSPREVRGLTSIATLVVTGRMHLAVMAALRSVPAVTLATQGKVEGLMSMLNVPELAVAPAPGFEASVIQALDRVQLDLDGYERAIAEGVRDAKRLARENFV